MGSSGSLRQLLRLLTAAALLIVLVEAGTPSDSAVLTINTADSPDPTKQYFTVDVPYADTPSTTATFPCDLDVGYGSFVFTTQALCDATLPDKTKAFTKLLLGNDNATSICARVGMPVGAATTALAPYMCSNLQPDVEVPCNILQSYNATTLDHCYAFSSKVKIWNLDPGIKVVVLIESIHPNEIIFDSVVSDPSHCKFGAFNRKGLRTSTTDFLQTKLPDATDIVFIDTPNTQLVVGSYSDPAMLSNPAYFTYNVATDWLYGYCNPDLYGDILELQALSPPSMNNTEVTAISVNRLPSGYIFNTYGLAVCGQQMLDSGYTSVRSRLNLEEAGLVLPWRMFLGVMSRLPTDCTDAKNITHFSYYPLRTGVNAFQPYPCKLLPTASSTTLPLLHLTVGNAPGASTWEIPLSALTFTNGTDIYLAIKPYLWQGPETPGDIFFGMTSSSDSNTYAYTLEEIVLGSRIVTALGGLTIVYNTGTLGAPSVNPTTAYSASSESQCLSSIESTCGGISIYDSVLNICAPAPCRYYFAQRYNEETQLCEMTSGFMGVLIFFIVLLSLFEIFHVGGYVMIKRRLEGYTRINQEGSNTKIH